VIYRDGAPAGLAVTTNFSDSFATVGTHTYYVRAVDYAGNISPPSAGVAVTKP
jgi:hypothetical protein